MLMRTDPFRDLDRVAQQVFGTAARPAAMGPMTFLVDPGKYDYHNCEQLAEQRKKAADRELELKLLIDRAERPAVEP